MQYLGVDLVVSVTDIQIVTHINKSPKHRETKTITQIRTTIYIFKKLIFYIQTDKSRMSRTT